MDAMTVIRASLRLMCLGAILAMPPLCDSQSLEVDIYQNMESGKPEDRLSEDDMNASSWGGLNADVPARWEFYMNDETGAEGKLWVSSAHSVSLPGDVVVGGKNRNIRGDRTWTFYNFDQDQYAIVRFSTTQWGHPYHERMTIAAYYSSEQTDRVPNQHDTIEMVGDCTYCVLQTTGAQGCEAPCLRAHSQICPSGCPECQSTFSPGIKIEAGKTYWVNLHFDGVAGRCLAMVFDPSDEWRQVGDTVGAESIPRALQVQSKARFGNCSPHGDGPMNETMAYFDHIVIDFSDPPFPLLPDTKAPARSRGLKIK
jgi:hypothetical protein